MGNSAFTITPRPKIRVLTVEDLPLRAAANSNVEMKIAESFTQKFLRAGKLLGHTLFYAQFLEFEGDTPTREPYPIPAIDKPPAATPITQWIREMDEMAQLALEVAQLQQRIHQLQEDGQGHLALPLQLQINALTVQTQIIAKCYDIPLSGGLQVVASAGGAEPAASTGARLADEIEKSLGDAPFTTLNGEEDVITDFRGGREDTLQRLQDIARGARHYSRLELLLEILLRGKSKPVIFEHGPGIIADLAVTVARNHPITLVDRVNYYPHRLIKTLPTSIQERIHFTTLDDAPMTSTDLAFWIHPDPHMAYRKNYLDPQEMGANVAPGGYLVVQTESNGLHHGFHSTPGWSLIYKFDGTIAPTLFQDIHNDVYIFRRDPVLVLPTHDSIAAILKDNPSATGPWDMGWKYNVDAIVSGATRYPRLEALTDHLVGGRNTPQIVERGPREFAALAIAIGRKHPVTMIDNFKWQVPDISNLPPEIAKNIRMLKIDQAPTTPTADLVFWIHPFGYDIASFDFQNPDVKTLNFAIVGQDVKPGGYLVIQTEERALILSPESEQEWELIYSGWNTGYLAPSSFVNFPSQTIVIRRLPTL